MTLFLQNPTPEEYEKIIKLAEKQLKHQETLKKCIKNYQQNHKNDEHYKEMNREKAKRHYQRHKEEKRDKYYAKKNPEIFQLMQIAI